jgi:hypothetical protein
MSIKIPLTPSEIELVTLWLAAQCLNQLRYSSYYIQHQKSRVQTKNQDQEVKNISAFEHAQYVVTNENNKAQNKRIKG